MALNQPLERLFDSADIEHAVEPEGARNVVHRAFRRQLPKEPEPLLGIGQRLKRLLWRSLQRRGNAHWLLVEALQGLGKSAQVGSFEQ
ncbi:hypothetical protein D3C76_1267420 [compost metagenome]